MAMTQIFRRGNLKFNFPELFRIIAFLALIESGFMLVPLAVALIGWEHDAIAFVIAIAVAVVFSSSLLVFVNPRSRTLGKRDGILLTALVWVVFSLFGMIPFIFAETALSPVDAFFESMSGFTTTGASVIPDVESLSNSILVWRSIMQWIGGLGIVIFTVALLPMLNSSGGMQMFNAELSGVTHDKLQPRISQTAMRLFVIYIVLTLCLSVALCLGPMDIFDAVCHSLSTVSTGGFSTRNASIGAWDSTYIRIVVIVFMFLGGLSFALMYRITMGKARIALRDENFRTYVGIILGVTVFITAILLFTNGFSTLKQLLVDPLFQVVSLITSTGYTVSGVSNWDEDIYPILMILMFTGACAGSTSGGAKVDRLIYLWKNSRNELHRIVHPNRFYALTINGTVRSTETVDKVVSFLWFYIAMIFLGGLLLSIVDVPLKEAFFSSFSCMGNTGLGIGSCAGSFADFPVSGKIILSLWMLIGRLEIFTVLILLTRSFWRR